MPLSSINRKSSFVNPRSGFTLIELLVVIAIIAVLSGLLTANFIGVRQRGRDAQRKSDLRQIQSALELYRADNGYYAPSLPACGSALPGIGTNPPEYMRKIPCDPLDDMSYTYTPTAGCNNTTVYCTTYTLSSCIENTNDPDRDTSNTCTPSRVSFTLLNP